MEKTYDMIDLENKIQELLKPLGMFIQYVDNTYAIYCSRWTKSMIITRYGFSIAKIENLETFEEIFKLSYYIAALMSSSNTVYQIKNPYKGCSSLEEMLIKKDLLYGND